MEKIRGERLRTDDGALDWRDADIEKAMFTLGGQIAKGFLKGPRRISLELVARQQGLKDRLEKVRVQ